jgi:TRAP-type C4-dicarboxylate transport system substrate-binding protein
VSVPFLVKTNGELEYVLSKLRPRLDAALEKKGFIAVNWANAGSPRFFSTFPIKTPADLPNAKIWTWDGDPGAAEGWKLAGFRPVVLSSTDIVPSLQTGLLNAVADPPLFVFVTRMFEKANYMSDLRWGMVAGATLVRKETWEKIPADIRPKLLAIADDTGKALSAEVDHLDADAIDQMKKQGLTIVPAEDLPAWQAAGERSWAAVRGKVVPAEIFDEAKRLVTEYRAQHKE